MCSGSRGFDAAAVAHHGRWIASHTVYCHLRIELKVVDIMDRELSSGRHDRDSYGGGGGGRGGQRKFVKLRRSGGGSFGTAGGGRSQRGKTATAIIAVVDGVFTV